MKEKACDRSLVLGEGEQKSLCIDISTETHVDQSVQSPDGRPECAHHADMDMDPRCSQVMEGVMLVERGANGHAPWPTSERMPWCALTRLSVCSGIIASV